MRQKKRRFRKTTRFKRARKLEGTTPLSALVRTQTEKMWHVRPPTEPESCSTNPWDYGRTICADALYLRDCIKCSQNLLAKIYICEYFRSKTNFSITPLFGSRAYAFNMSRINAPSEYPRSSLQSAGTEPSPPTSNGIIVAPFLWCGKRAKPTAHGPTRPTDARRGAQRRGIFYWAITHVRSMAQTDTNTLAPVDPRRQERAEDTGKNGKAGNR